MTSLLLSSITLFYTLWHMLVRIVLSQSYSHMRASPAVSAYNKRVLCSFNIVAAFYSSAPYISHDSFIIHNTVGGWNLNTHRRCSRFCQLHMETVFSSPPYRRWKAEGIDCTQNWKSLLLRMMPAQISTRPLATVETTTARIKVADISPCGIRPWGAAGRKGTVMRLF